MYNHRRIIYHCFLRLDILLFVSHSLEITIIPYNNIFQHFFVVNSITFCFDNHCMIPPDLTWIRGSRMKSILSEFWLTGAVYTIGDVNCSSSIYCLVGDLADTVGGLRLANLAGIVYTTVLQLTHCQQIILNKIRKFGK